MQKKLVVIAGGPGSGKTSIIDLLTVKGYCCYPEVSREIIKEAQNQGVDQFFLDSPLVFSELLLQGRVKQYQMALDELVQVVFLDRGIPDVLAYLDFIQHDYPPHFYQTSKNYNYSKIFILPPWEAIYENDDERFENFQQASEIYQHLKNTYFNLGYDLIEVPHDNLENRVQFILNHI